MQQSHFQVWERSAEEEISDATCAGQEDWCLVFDGAGSGVRRGRDEDDCEARRETLGIEWREDVYHQRPLRGRLRGHGGDGQLEEFAWDQRIHPGKGNGRIQAGEERKQAGDAGERHFGSDFFGLSRAGRKHVGGGGRRIHRQLEDTGWRAYFDCGAGYGNGTGGFGSGDKIREATKTIWAADQRVSGYSIQAGGHGYAGG